MKGSRGRLLFQGLGEILQQSAQGSKQILIICPFIKLKALRWVLENTNACPTVVTRWRIEELCSGVSDIEVYSFLKSTGGTLLLLNNLHTKYYRFDNQVYIGSANLTSNGLGLKPHGNEEVLWGPVSEVSEYEINVISRSHVVTDEDFEHFKEATSILKDSFHEVGVFETSVPCLSISWTPRTRSPEALFELYNKNGDDLTSTSRADAEYDLSALSPPSDLSQENFYRFVASRLQLSPFFRQIEDFVRPKTRRFGEMTQFLVRCDPELSRGESQHLWQTTFRWLLAFQPEKYSKSRQSYSELISFRL